MSDLLQTSPDFQLFNQIPAGMLFCLESARRDLNLAQKSLSVLPVRFRQSIYSLDGINAFDPYPFASAARVAGATGCEIEEALGRVHLSRSFTIHQLRACVERLLPPLLTISPRPLVLILGIEHLFLDESLALWEREHTLRKIMERLRDLSTSGLPVLMTHEPEGGGRSWWKPILEEASDRIARLHVPQPDRPELRWIKHLEEENHGKNNSNI